MPVITRMHTATAAILLTAALVATGASAATAEVTPLTATGAGSAQPADNTEVTLTDAPVKGGIFHPDAIESAGGGTWSYGSSIDGIYKRCFSNYNHNDKYHSSTAILADGVDKRYANAGTFSQASVEAGLRYTCNAYWATY